MITKKLFYIIISMLAVMVVIFQACKKEEKTNHPPTCNIITPTNGQEFTQGENVNITADAIDNDGSISEVRFFVDDVEKGYVSTSPYNYQWITTNTSVGLRTIRATSFDNSGGYNSDKIIIDIIHGGAIGAFTDPRDGQTYKTVEIGNRTWFAENLNYETSNSWWYDNSFANGDIYGRLYLWDAAMIACPSGWHLSTDDEWKTLEMQLGLSQSEADQPGWRGTDEGKELKSTSGWNNGGNGMDVVSFKALPGGYHKAGDFSGLGHYSGWWSSTEFGISYAWCRSLLSNIDGIRRENYHKGYGLSVRCVSN